MKPPFMTLLSLRAAAGTTQADNDFVAALEALANGR